MTNLRASRMTALVAVVVAVLMVGSPAAIIGSMNIDPVGMASAADGTRIFEIGVVDMTVATLNPNTYTMVAEGMIIFPLYSYLIQWDKAGENVIGDLARAWTVSPDGLEWEFELVNTAYFVEYDVGTTVLTHDQKVTSEDVKWSIDTTAADDGSRLNSIWPEGIIDETWTDGPTIFGIRMTGPFVPMQDSLMSQPIFPKYYWEGESFVNFDNDPPIGSGPFYYKTDGLPDLGYARLARNPYWHGEASYGWQLHVDEFVMSRYDDAGTCWTALTVGDIDAMMGVEPDVYVDAFDVNPDDYPQLEGFHQSNGFVYEFNLNQMTDALRKEKGGPLNAGDNNQLLLNGSIKKAISMAVDRDDIISEDLYGYGEWTTTLVPSQNPMSHSYGQDGHDCILEPGDEGPAAPDTVDRVAARDLLWDAGWRYDEAGRLYEKYEDDFDDVCPLWNGSASDPERESLTFDFITLSTMNTWETIGIKIVDWCEQIGVELNFDLKSVNEMNTAWYSANYDIWLWDWVFGPYVEAASGVLVVLTTDAIGTDSDIYMSDPEFDALYNEAIREMDFETRQEILYDMQDIVYLNRGCQALAFREDLYAFNTDDWENFGDLNSEYYLLPDVWPTWLCMEMNPVGNAAPSIGGINVEYNTVSGLAEVGVPVTFSAFGVGDSPQDPEDLEYTWIWGFGGDEKWVDTTSTVDYEFTTDGVYTVTLVVTETTPAGGHADYLSSYETCEITVRDMSNNAPHSLEIEMDPLDPDTGTLVTFSGSAVDDEDDEMFYSWTFGDGTSATGPEVTHQFVTEDSYTVTLLVDDHRYGEEGSRPATLETLIAVGPNHAPTISVPDYGSVTVKSEETYTVMANDADSRDSLQFTWDWGDGNLDVTTTPYATHSYQLKGDYVVTVYADDQTGLGGHNVSDTGDVYVEQEGNSLPVIVEFEVSSDHAYVEQAVTFSARAADGDGNALTFTFEFDDGTNAVETFPETDPMMLVDCSVDKAYSEAGSYSVYLYVTDGTATATSQEIVMDVESNEAPEILSFSPLAYYDTGIPMTFSVVAIDDDGDDLTYTWDWDDDTSDVTATEVTTHTFAESGTYTVSVTADDGKGLEDTAEADVTLNWVPWINPKLSLRTLNQGQLYTFSVTAVDNDTDSLAVMWDFGDGTDYVVADYGDVITHTYADLGTFTRTVYIWDDFLEHRSTHNVSSSGPVVVKDPSVDYPPDVDPLDDIYAVAGEELEFMVYATDDNDDDLTYTWIFDDGTELVGDPPVYHTYVAEGEYYLVVWVCDESGIPANNVSVEATVYVAADMPPVADAGGDREVDEDTWVEFTGAASTDEFPIPSDGYAWTVTDYDGDHIFDTMEFDYSFTEPGVYNVELVVTDSIGQESDPDVIEVTVLDVTAPTADAGPDQEVHNGTLVEFAGSGTDNVDEPLSYLWSFVYDDELETLTGESPTFTFSIMGIYTVTLLVEDAAGNSVTDNVVITVTDLVDPVADAGTDQTVLEGDTVTFDGADSSDADGPIADYTWEFTYDGVTETLTGSAPTFKFEIPGVYEVTLTVEDGVGNSDDDTVSITVLANDPPVADAGADQTVTVGDTVELSASGSTDPNDDVMDFVWTFAYDDEEKELTGENVSFTFDIADTYTVTLNVTDARGGYDTDAVVVTVEEEAEPTNEAPVADAGDDKTVAVGTEVTFDSSGSTDDTGIVNFTWTFTYDGETQTLTGASPKFVFEIAGEYDVTLTVEDGDGETDTDTVTITVEEEVDDEKTFIESYGLALGAIIALVIVALVLLFVMKGRKGKSASMDDMSAGEPEVPSEDSTEQG